MTRIGQKHPKGTAWPIDDIWREAVRARMREQGISPAELARRIGASTAGISMLFSGKSTNSRLVPAIHAQLGMAAPSMSASAAELRSVFPHLESHQIDAIMATALSMAKSNAEKAMAATIDKKGKRK